MSKEIVEIIIAIQNDADPQQTLSRDFVFKEGVPPEGMEEQIQDMYSQLKDLN